MKNLNPQKNDQFDQIIVSRLLADDFAQPQVMDIPFYKNKALAQISSAIKSIADATSPHEFLTAIAQANAFIDAALDYEFIDISEKAAWLDQLAKEVRVQRIGEYP